MKSPMRIAFFITLAIYALAGAAIFYKFDNEQIVRSQEDAATSLMLKMLAQNSQNVEQKKQIPTPQKTAKIPAKKQEISESKLLDSEKKNEKNDEQSLDSANQNLSEQVVGDDEYTKKIKQIIAKEVKKNAAHLSGETAVAFEIVAFENAAKLQNLRVLKSSGQIELDERALYCIKKASAKFPQPDKTRDVQLILAFKKR